MLHAAVFLLSCSSLAYEILLTRLFSITQWHHLSFMVISIALFGFASGGITAAVFFSKSKWKNFSLGSDGSTRILILLFSATSMVSMAVICRIPLDYFRLPTEKVQSLYLVTAYFMPACPFFFSGVLISAAFSCRPAQTGSIYLSTMAGSAAGAAIPVIFLPIFGETSLILLSSLLPLTLLPPWETDKRTRISTSRAFTRGTVPVIVLAAFFLTPTGGKLLTVNPSPYKAISVLSRFPGTETQPGSSHIMGRTDLVKSPTIRFAPGLSLSYTGKLPGQEIVFRDGDQGTVLYHRQDLSFALHTLSSSGYIGRGAGDSILIILQGGGLSIPCAYATGSRDITILAPHPETAKHLEKHYMIPAGAAPARSYLTGSHKKYDLIHLEDWGRSIPSAGSLSQEHLLTVEAFKEYFQHLKPGGTLVISRKLLLPPSDSIRIWGTAMTALRESGVTMPQEHLVMLRNWDTFTLLVYKNAQEDAAPALAFADRLGFDTVHSPDITEVKVNQYNIFKEPWHHIEIAKLTKAFLQGQESQYWEQSLFDTAPTRDSTPYHYHFLKWTKIFRQVEVTGGRVHTMLLSGEVILPVLLAQTILVGLLLLLIPAFCIHEKENRIKAPVFIFFLCLGAGFIMVELFYIKIFTLVFGDPTISFTMVLTSLLLFSGIGGYLSNYISREKFKIICIPVIMILVISGYAQDLVTGFLLGKQETARYLLAALFMAPTGIILGMPFSPGMKFMTTSPAMRSWAWAANGCSSVPASIIAQQIAMDAGIPAIIYASIFIYFTAFLCTRAYGYGFKS